MKKNILFFVLGFVLTFLLLPASRNYPCIAVSNPGPLTELSLCKSVAWFGGVRYLVYETNWVRNHSEQNEFPYVNDPPANPVSLSLYGVIGGLLAVGVVKTIDRCISKKSKA